MIVESRPWFLSFAEHPFKIIFAVRPDISPLGIALERLERPTSSLKHSYTSPPNRGQRGKSGAPIHRRPKRETKPLQCCWGGDAVQSLNLSEPLTIEQDASSEEKDPQGNIE
jgi:hypothetical protein